MNSVLPLITPLANKYFEKAMNNDKEEYYRSLDMRLCLEIICDEMLYELISEESKEKWKDLTLHSKLKLMKGFIPANIVDDLINAKYLGNIGVHNGEEAELTDDKLNISLETIHEFSLELIVNYFRKNGFLNGKSWVPTVFSTLPPVYRIVILEKYFEFDKSLIIIDKLSMAYLKNNNYKEALEFIEKCYSNGHIDLDNKFMFYDKLESLNHHLSKFSIARDIPMAKENLEKLLLSIPENEICKFIVLISMVVGIKLKK